MTKLPYVREWTSKYERFTRGERVEVKVNDLPEVSEEKSTRYNIYVCLFCTATV